MRHRNGLLIALLLALAGATVRIAPAQERASATLYGVVSDAATGEPLEAASVYFGHTLLGAATDREGRYVIEGVEPGTHTLIVSRIGYAGSRQEVVVDAGSDLRIDHRLEAEVYDLGEVAVTAERPRGWDKQSELFTKLFLGTMPFEEEAVLRNPYALDFREDRRRLSASADNVLVVDNAAIGYRVFFQLMGFEWNKRERILTFSGAGYFIQDDRVTATQHDNRERIYSWLAHASPSHEGEWAARVIRARCACAPAYFGTSDLGVCQCTYQGLTRPAYPERFDR
ncbi:MAG: carboxypeptidase-like regulatory domain-containing protein [Rhodothermales bacterium]